ncbi:hypothetical protein QA641_15005 [Bradyrhizobium sp. CB1650]|uniref:hypothetical protein n=1 Tax=Bradyrhizobium sp. CB1650 TaxID=3039153 RepID=UPI002435CB82|nr:hypothetical protein [Bradyrhizobium sp. CB1650]WGD55084.1 hypothetical protein QA641_15005 [Bradyrhizobium sp. CB1650]
MSAPPSRKLRQLADGLMVHAHHTRVNGDAIIAIVGPLGEIRPHRGELLVVIKRSSAALVRRLLGLAILDVSSDGSLKLGRMPRPDEAPILRDLLGLTMRRT